jgi:hypothetical protein
MPYFAKAQPTATPTLFIVEDVISADQEFIDSGAVGPASDWWQTSYNTRGNVHYAPSPPAEPDTPDGGTPLRANYAGIGFTLDNSVVIDGVVGVFYAPMPTSPGTWVLNTSTWVWENTDPTPPTE